MFQVPVSFVYNLSNLTIGQRRAVLHEFAVNGAKHLVLNFSLLQEMMTNTWLIRQLHRELDAEGLTFLDAHAPFGKYEDLASPTPDAVQRLRLAITVAGMFSTKTMAVHVGCSEFYPETPLEQQIDRMRRALDELLPVAESNDVVLCIENIWHPSNTPEVLLTLKKEYPTKYLGLCYDSGHANVMAKGGTFPETHPQSKFWFDKEPVWDDQILKKMLPEIVICHLHDNSGQWDHHYKPGHEDGSIDWNKIVPVLKKAPKLQVIQSEVKMTDDKAPCSIREVVEAFNKLGEIE